MEKELFDSYAETTHSKIIGWTANCDTKATVIFAFVGVLIPLLFTNKYINSIIEKLITPIRIYIESGEGEFCALSTFTIITLVLAFGLLVTAVFYLLNSLTANIDKTERNVDSVIFFASIGSLKNEDWHDKIESINNQEYKTDLLNQIHICSQICTKKFKAYNLAVLNIKFAIPSLLLFLLLSLFI